MVASGLRTGRHRALAAVLFAATLLCHLIPAIFAVGRRRGLARARRRPPPDGGRRRARRVGRPPVGSAGWRGRRWPARSAWASRAWWLLPFDAEQPYTTNMGYTKVFGYPHLLFPGSARWVLLADLVGVAFMVVRRNRVALFLVVMAGLSALAMIVDPASKLYNVRFLPLWFLCLYLLAGYAAGRGGGRSSPGWRRRRQLEPLGAVGPPGPRHDGRGAWSPGMRVTRFRRPVPAAVAAGCGGGPADRPGRGVPGRRAAAGRAVDRPWPRSASTWAPTSRAPGRSGTTRATRRSPTTPSSRPSSR